MDYALKQAELPSTASALVMLGSHRRVPTTLDSLTGC